MTRSELQYPLRVQLAILGVLAAAYLVLSTYWVPPHNRLLLPLGVMTFAGAAWVGRSTRSDRNPGQAPLLLWFALLFLLVMIPVAGAPGPRDRGFLTAFLGVFCALGFWATYRYASPASDPHAPRRSLGGDVLWGLAWGTGMAVFYSLIALVIALVSLFSEENLFTNFAVGYVIGAYWGGGLLGGALVGLLRPFARWPLGTMLIGIPVAAAVYGAVMIAIVLIESSGLQITREGTVDLALQDHLWVLFSIAVVVGPVGALYFRGVPDPDTHPRPTNA